MYLLVVRSDSATVAYVNPDASLEFLKRFQAFKAAYSVNEVWSVVMEMKLNVRRTLTRWPETLKNL